MLITSVLTGVLVLTLRGRHATARQEPALNYRQNLLFQNIFVDQIHAGTLMGARAVLLDLPVILGLVRLR